MKRKIENGYKPDADEKAFFNEMQAKTKQNELIGDKEEHELKISEKKSQTINKEVEIVTDSKIKGLNEKTELKIIGLIALLLISLLLIMKKKKS